ncbi:MAG: 16S rRNA processing protein RimM [Nitrospira sp.]|nr:16S rRNA processing protein RimM [Nitrospira sp.]
MVGSIETVIVGQIGRPFGVKGQVKVRPLSDVPGRFEALTDVRLVAKDGRMLETSVTTVQRAGTELIMRFVGLTTPEEAKIWSGGLVQAPRGTTPALPTGQYYECDLVGLAVQTDQEQPLGVLEEIWEVPGNHVFVVRQGSKETLIPAAKEWVTAVDLDRRIMTVRILSEMDE